MSFTRITAAEAAAMIQNGDNIGLSGFTPAGTAKALPCAGAAGLPDLHRHLSSYNGDRFLHPFPWTLPPPFFLLSHLPMPITFSAYAFNHP